MADQIEVGGRRVVRRQMKCPLCRKNVIEAVPVDRQKHNGNRWVCPKCVRG